MPKTDHDIIKVLIHWLANRTIAKKSEKAFYNDVEVMAGDVYQQIGLLHTAVCIHIYIYIYVLLKVFCISLIGTRKTSVT